MSEALIKELFEAGTPPALVARVAMEFGRLQGAAEIVENRRAKDRERKRSLPRNSTESTEITEGVEQKENPPHPLKKNTPPLDPKGSSPIEKPTRLPDDFVMPSDWIEWAMSKRGWSRSDAVEEAECFSRYWQAKGRDAARRTWKKVWQNWVVNSRRDAKPAPSSSFLENYTARAA